MKRHRFHLVTLASLAAALASASDWTVQALDSGGFDASVAFGINDNGQVVGYAVDATGASHAARWEGGTMTLLAGGAAASEAYRINNRGEAVGFARFGDNGHATLWDAGGATDLGTLGGTFSFANDISESGIVVGSVGAGLGSSAFSWTRGGGMVDHGNLDADNPRANAGFNGVNANGTMVGTAYTMFSPFHAAMYDGRAIADIAGPGRYSSSMALAVNDAGTIVGWTNDGSGNGHAAILYADGAHLDLGGLGLDGGKAEDVNNAGDVVGSVFGDDGTGVEVGRAFLHRNGHMQALDDLLPTGTGWTSLVEAHGINERGQIVGTGLYMGEIRGFVLTPHAAPEPASMAALAVGMIGLVRRRKAKKA